MVEKDGTVFLIDLYMDLIPFDAFRGFSVGAAQGLLALTPGAGGT